jgi:hypothetical protein
MKSTFKTRLDLIIRGRDKNGGARKGFVQQGFQFDVGRNI